MPSKTTKDKFKSFSALIGALFIAYLVLKLFIYLIATAVTVTLSVATVVFIVILALPVYVILRKKLFK